MGNSLGKVVIVTGGSRGIGAATSKLLAKQGYKVCVNYLKSNASAEALCQDITQLGGQAFAYQADVANENKVDELFAAVQKRYGTITHLVNNAGILCEQKPFTEISSGRFKQVMQSNVLSAFLCSRAFAKQAVGPGAIANVSSVAARSGSPFEYVDYAASKGAMDTLTKGVAAELAGRNIRVNSVRPGFIHTDMHADGGEPRRVQRLSPQIPLQRGGTPDEVANAICWLLSDEASYVTGSFIDIAGGK